MSFRFKKNVQPRIIPCEVTTRVMNTQFDDDGNEIVSFSDVPCSQVESKMPLPSEYTFQYCMQSGNLNPVNLSDYSLSPNVDDVSSFVDNVVNNSNNNND